jgi:putative transposase
MAVFSVPLSLRMVEEMLAARGISVTHETIRQWASNSAKNSPEFAVHRHGDYNTLI